MPKSRIFNVANMSLTLFAKIKFSRKFPNFTIISQAQTIQYFNGMCTKRRMNVLKSLLFSRLRCMFKQNALSSISIIHRIHGRIQRVTGGSDHPPPPIGKSRCYMFLRNTGTNPRSNCTSREVRTTLCKIHR